MMFAEIDQEIVLAMVGVWQLEKAEEQLFVNEQSQVFLRTQRLQKAYTAARQARFERQS